jgi:hypothetical protein
LPATKPAPDAVAQVDAFTGAQHSLYTVISGAAVPPGGVGAAIVDVAGLPGSGRRTVVGRAVASRHQRTAGPVVLVYADDPPTAPDLAFVHPGCPVRVMSLMRRWPDEAMQAMRAADAIVVLLCGDDTPLGTITGGATDLVRAMANQPRSSRAQPTVPHTGAVLVVVRAVATPGEMSHLDLGALVMDPACQVQQCFLRRAHTPVARRARVLCSNAEPAAQRVCESRDESTEHLEPHNVLCVTTTQRHAAQCTQLAVQSARAALGVDAIAIYGGEVVECDNRAHPPKIKDASGDFVHGHPDAPDATVFVGARVRVGVPVLGVPNASGCVEAFDEGGVTVVIDGLGARVLVRPVSTMESIDKKGHRTRVATRMPLSLDYAIAVGRDTRPPPVRGRAVRLFLSLAGEDTALARRMRGLVMGASALEVV